MSHDIRAERNKHLRKRILLLLQDNQQLYASVPDHYFIASTLTRRGVTLGYERCRALLLELRSRGLVTFREYNDPETEKLVLKDIAITHKGIDVLEGTVGDPSVGVE